jgi:hypothetical protein
MVATRSSEAGRTSEVSEELTEWTCTVAVRVKTTPERVVEAEPQEDKGIHGGRGATWPR